MEAIKVDLSGLTIGDLRLFDAMQNRQASQDELITFLDRVVVGGASQLPLTRLGDVMAAIQAAVAQIANPVDGQGKA
jgi:hypothetical protein